MNSRPARFDMTQSDLRLLESIRSTGFGITRAVEVLHQVEVEQALRCTIIFLGTCIERMSSLSARDPFDERAKNARRAVVLLRAAPRACCAPRRAAVLLSAAPRSC